MASKSKILILTDWFYPAFRAGGPIRSCAAFIDFFHRDFELFLLCSNHDAGTTECMPDIETGRWLDYQSKAKVMYAETGHPDRRSLLKAIEQVNPDFLYLNSLYSFRFSLLPLWLHKKGLINAGVIMAPRGMLKKSALSFKPLKKRLFLALFRFFGFPEMIRFQATDETERADIHDQFPGSDVVLVPNVPANIAVADHLPQKRPGHLLLLFIGRVHPIKNLDLVLSVLKDVKGSVEFTIVGSLEDRAYWERCCAIIDRLPKEISVDWKGELPHERIAPLLGEYHLMVLPTRGENFGHAIFESLAVGRPVLISDQTPWRQLEQSQAGWDIPLNDVKGYTHAMNEAVQWSHDDFMLHASGARSVATAFFNNAGLKERYLKLFS